MASQITTWSEFQKPSQTATERGESELRRLDFKTTWSEFQKPCQTTVTQGKAELCIYYLNKTSPPQSFSQAVVCVSTPRMYPRRKYFLVLPNFSVHSCQHVLSLYWIFSKIMGSRTHLWKSMGSAEPIEPISTTTKICLMDRQKY